MCKTKPKFRHQTLLTVAILLNTSAGLAASATSGSLVVFNGLANIASATGIGFTASPIKVQVYDTTGLCSTTNNVAYNGAVVVNWSSANTHSTNVCTTLASVTITPLANPQTGTVIYGSTTAVPAAGAISFTAPTTLYNNMVLMPIGLATPATAAPTPTAWSNLLGVEPTFNPGGGDLATAGVPGVSTLNNLRARTFMRMQGIKPYEEKENRQSRIPNE